MKVITFLFPALLFSQNWGLDKINVRGAWTYLGQGSPSTVVAVIDTGMDYTHPELATHVWSAPHVYFLNLRGIPYQCPAGSHGFDVVRKSCDPMDVDGHGTGISGVVAQVAPGVKVLSIRMIGDRYSVPIRQAEDAVTALVQIQQQFGVVRVVNNSWRIWESSSALNSAFQQLSNMGVAVVSASGDDGASYLDWSPVWPAAWRFTGGFTVAATAQYPDFWGWELWRGSNLSYSSDMVNIAAPGENIYTTYLHGQHAYGTGTSLAAPFVAGTLALMQSCGSPAMIAYYISHSTAPVANAQIGRLDAAASARSCLTRTIRH